MSSIPSRSLAQDVYNEIRQRLINGELPPGSRLVNRTLGKQFGVSLIPVREALSRLASEGLVEHIPDAGAYVRRLDRKELIQLYEVREPLESFAASAAAKKIDVHSLRRLKEICAAWQELAEQARETPKVAISGKAVDRWIDNDIAFHEIIIEAADNPWLTQMLLNMRLLARVMKSKPSTLSLSFAAATYLQHVRLVRALERRDSERAGCLMAEQIRSGLRLTLANFEQTQSR